MATSGTSILQLPDFKFAGGGESNLIIKTNAPINITVDLFGDTVYFEMMSNVSVGRHQFWDNYLERIRKDSIPSSIVFKLFNKTGLIKLNEIDNIKTFQAVVHFPSRFDDVLFGYGRKSDIYREVINQTFMECIRDEYILLRLDDVFKKMTFFKA